MHPVAYRSGVLEGIYEMSDHVQVQRKNTATSINTNSTLVSPTLPTSTRAPSPQPVTAPPQAVTEIPSNATKMQAFSNQYEKPDLQAQLERAKHKGHNFSRISVHSPKPAYSLEPAVIQLKLSIGQPGDKYDQEADRVAEQVMRMPEPINQKLVQCQGIEEQEEVQMKPLATAITPFVQREAAVEEDKDMVQAKVTRLKSKLFCCVVELCLVIFGFKQVQYEKKRYKKVYYLLCLTHKIVFFPNRVTLRTSHSAIVPNQHYSFSNAKVRR